MVYGEDHLRVHFFLAVPQDCSVIWGFHGCNGTGEKKRALLSTDWQLGDLKSHVIHPQNSVMVEALHSFPPQKPLLDHEGLT
jgi:hypothetical protein